MKKKRLVPLLVVLAMALSILTACNSANSGPVTLNFMHYWSEYAPEMQKMADLYHQEHPNITVELTISDNYSQLLGSSIAAGTTPDIFASAPYAVSSQYATASADLTKEEFWKEVQPSSYPSVTADNVRIAVPVQTQRFAMIYNKDVFEKAGITKLPETLDELKSVADQLKSKGFIPFATSFKTTWTIGHMFSMMYSLDPNLTQINADLLDKKTTFKEQAFPKKIASLIDLIKSYTEKNSFNVDFSGAAAMIANGEAAMYLEGDWTEPVIRKSSSTVKLGFLPVPFSNDPADRRLFVDTAIVLHLAKDSKHPKEAMDFLTWIVTSKSAKKWWSDDMKVTSPITGIAPTSGDLLQSSADISEHEPQVVTTWGISIVPPAIQTNSGPFEQKFAAGTITAQQWIDAASKVYADYKPQ